MIIKSKAQRKAIVKILLGCIVIGWMCLNVGNSCQAAMQPGTPSGLAPDIQEVVTLSHQGFPDDVIINFIKNSERTYNLSTNDVIYLNDQGISQGVISWLLQMPKTPEKVAPPAPEINFQYFHDQLVPYGRWVNVGGVMYWHPAAAITDNPGWRPYYDMGQWVQTDNGLYWQSDYTWGDIPFHYGRWVLDPAMGWLWAPDYTWGPAWVFWRQDKADGAIGWAPFPVGAVFVDGVFMFNGVRVAADFDFGLSEACYTFVEYNHFHEKFYRLSGIEGEYNIDRERLHGFYGRSVLRNDFRKDKYGRFVNNGIGLDLMKRLTRGEYISFEERNPVGDRSRLNAQRNLQAVSSAYHANVENVPSAYHTPRSPAINLATKHDSEVFRPPIQTHETVLALATKARSSTGSGALIGGVAAGATAGRLVGNMIDQQQQQRLQQQYPQTWNKIQHNGAVYANSLPPATPLPATAPTPSAPLAAATQSTSPTSAAPTTHQMQPFTVDDIKALTAAGVKPDAINKEIEISQSKFCPQDIVAAQQANPPIDAAVIAYMKNSAL